MSFKEFTKELSGSRIEGELVKAGFYSLITSFIVIGLFYFLGILNQSLIGKYGQVLLLMALSYAVILIAVRQIGNYGQMGCMSGMMIGMTIGMIAGFLPGFYIGMTNGMFLGSVFGMVVGITSVMLLNDNVAIMALIVFVVCTVIMVGLNYMVYNEMKEIKEKRGDQSRVIWLTAGLMILTILIVVYGPRSLLVV